MFLATRVLVSHKFHPSHPIPQCSRPNQVGRWIPWDRSTHDHSHRHPDRLLRLGADLERENKRIAEINAQRVRNRGYLVFATDPSKGVDSAEYQQVYATEARTPNQAIAKVRPLAEGRRLQAFLTTGKYRDELADARWVA
jgi:hypothetical protein